MNERRTIAQIKEDLAELDRKGVELKRELKQLELIERVYPQYDKRYKETFPKPKNIGKDVTAEDIENYCLESFLVEGGIEAYAAAAVYAKEHDFRVIVDIGCSLGFQSSLFKDLDLYYIGIEKIPEKNMWPATKFIATAYPFHIPATPKLRAATLGISRLCVGFECQGEAVYDALYRDFDHLMISGSNESIQALTKRYGVPERIDSVSGELWYVFTKQSLMEETHEVKDDD